MKSILFGAMLLLASSCKADMHFFNFEFRGFLELETGEWVANQFISGSFAGDDRNSDEQISRDELTSLVVNSRDYFNCPTPAPSAGCGISEFLYRPGEVVKLHAWAYSYSYEFSYDVEYQTLDPTMPFFREAYLAEEHGVHMTWMPTLGTSYWLVPTVPEPSTMAMSLLGLAAIGAVRKRASFAGKGDGAAR